MELPWPLIFPTSPTLTAKPLYKLLLSLLSGILLSLAWPEIGNLTPLIFIALTPLLFIASFTKPHQWRSLFLYSFLSFLLWHILTDYWMLYSTLLGSITAWIVNSFLMAAALSLAFSTHKKISFVPLSLIWAFFWLSLEILHLSWELSWPWMNLAHVFANHVNWIQWFEYTGVYGGTFWVITINGFIFDILTKFINKNTKRGLLAAGLLSLYLIAPMLFSYWLLQRPLKIGNELNISVVQTNFDTYTEKFSGLSPLQQSKQIVQQIGKINHQIDLCVLPETAIPENIIENDTNYPASIRLLLKQSRACSYPIVGSYYSKDSLNSYNTASLIRDGKIMQSRHKSKLVPFAETMPFEYITRGLKSLIEEEGGMGYSFTRDKEARVFTINKPKKSTIGVLVCFESIFPDFTSEMQRKGAEFFIIITNDDWWGNTAGYQQHFAYARLQAISNRRPVARAANTGISGFIDAWGQVLQKSTYQEKTTLTQKLYSPLYQSFFSQYEVLIRWFIIIIAVVFFSLGTLYTIL